MVRTSNTQRAILDIAEDLLQDRGFNGFSYADISAELGVKNAAVHYHFPTKEDLGVSIIRRYRERFKLWIKNARVKDLASQQKLDWFLNIYSSTRADHGKVCLAGVLETEFNSIPESLREQTQGLTKELIAWLQAILDDGRQAGVFRFNGDPADKAALILSSLQGALQMARALGTGKFQAVVGQIKKDLLA